MPTTEPHSALAGIVDIEPPPAPITGNTDEWLLFTIALLALTALGAGLWRRYQSPRARVRRALKHLRRRYLADQLDGRATAFALAAILRQHLGVPHLTASNTPPVGADPWAAIAGEGKTSRPGSPPLRGAIFDAAFLERLSHARFAAESPSRETLRALLADATRYCRKGQP